MESRRPLGQPVEPNITCFRHEAWKASRKTRTFAGRRLLQTQVASAPQTVPFRKQLKDEAKQKKELARKTTVGTNKGVIKNSVLDNWELTVGLEIHAQLNTEHKLFSGERPDSLIATRN
ncbi:MAG: hypothetical protein L6R40_006698 [Gallowayella cf. fulva]|nr:MAG: hypothetical protein L6R40_006698 [Xanthomendoza cf. fulva]